MKNEKENLKSIQYENIYYEDDVPFRDISGKITSKLIYYGIGLFIILLVAGFIIKIPREVNISFELKGGLNEYIVQFPEKVYVRDVFVKTGDSTYRDMPLLNISSLGISGMINEIEINKTSLQFHKNEAYSLFQSKALINESRKSGFSKNITNLSNEIEVNRKSLRNEEANLNNELSIKLKNFERNKQLFKDGVISEIELEASESLLNKAKQILTNTISQYKIDLANLISKKQDLENQKQLLDREYNQLSLVFRNDSIELVNKLEQSYNKLKFLYGNYKINESTITILSPEKGIITLITSKESEIPSEEIVLKMQKDSISYYAYSEASSTQIGKLCNGNKAVLKFNSFPYYYYGTMKSIVTNISYSSNEKGNYPIRLEIRDYGKLKDDVKKGMTGNATIIIEEKSIADFILRAFLKSVSIEKTKQQ